MIAVLAQASGGYLFKEEATGGGPNVYLILGGFLAVIAVLLILQLVRKRISPTKSRSSRNGGRTSAKRRKAKNRDALQEFTVSYIDMDPLINPPTGRPRPIPEELPLGTVLISQRLGVKCLLLDHLEEVGRKTLKEICARKLRPTQAVYLPMGSQVYRDELLHQGRALQIKVRKGTLFLSVGGHPNTYLLDTLQLPLRRELSSNPEVLPVTETTAQRYLQGLLDIPHSFELLKEDVLFDASKENVRRVDKGTLVISRSGALTGLMLEEYDLPHEGPLSDLDALFQLRTNYQRYPIESLIQRSAKIGGREVEIEKGSFIFSSAGKVYFVWRDGVKADETTLTNWATGSQINHPSLLEVSKTQKNAIGGPGEVITQDELNYLRDVFRQAGSTNIVKETLLLDRNVFYKFMMEMPYAQTGKFRAHLGKGVVILNSASRGTFSIELGGKDVEITDLDIAAVREHLLADGRMLVKIGTLLRIRDERFGDWVYKVVTNLFYPYDTITRPYMEEFIPESIRYDGREPKNSTIIGPQDDGKPHEGDIGASGEPVGDLLAQINNELIQKERTVFVLDGTMFNWKGRLYRTNEELVFRPHEISSKLLDQDFQVLAKDWKINPVVEEGTEEEAPTFIEEEEDLEDLPFDTDAVR